MEQTNDGFTFRRVSTNRVERAEIACAPGRRTESIAGQDAFELDGFTFRKLSTRPGAKEQAKSMQKPAAPKKGGVTVRIGGKGPKKEAAAPTEGSFVFKTVKRRRTVRLDESLDLSTESVNRDAVSEIKDSTILTEIGGQEPASVEEAVPRLSREAAAPPAPLAAAARVKSNEVYRTVSGQNINGLVRACIAHLRDDTEYAREISRHCDANYFSDIDYKREMDGAQTRLEGVQAEISKWNSVYGSLGRVQVERLERPPETAVDGFDEAALAEEFSAKADRLMRLENRLSYFLEHAKARSEGILKNIFGAVDDRSVNALFLLKAMSKLGK
ncbi:hypothetical protein PAPHI01_2398 [Pancytospora philotis]|nr:hypothetical protein PAPHI01_2398 [Pancytospora philotis]